MEVFVHSNICGMRSTRGYFYRRAKAVKYNKFLFLFYFFAEIGNERFYR